MACQIAVDVGVRTLVGVEKRLTSRRNCRAPVGRQYLLCHGSKTTVSVRIHVIGIPTSMFLGHSQRLHNFGNVLMNQRVIERYSESQSENLKRLYRMIIGQLRLFFL
jgi:hypothetical protein